MYKKAITYTDFDGIQKTETFYFNLTKAEMIEMELRTGGMQEMLQRITDAQDSYQVAEVIKDIIARSYGEKTPDGKRFIKNQELMDAFKATEAYSELFMELLTNATAASDFVNGIIPNEVRDAAQKEMERRNAENGVVGEITPAT